MDSRATDYISNSDFTFYELDRSRSEPINCTDKGANLQSQGEGVVNFMSDIRDNAKLDEIIFLQNLTRNVLSLCKFVEKGMRVYMDKEKIDIFVPKSREIILSGLYDKPFWNVTLKIQKNIDTSNKNKEIWATLTTRKSKYTDIPISDKNKNKRLKKINVDNLYKEVSDNVERVKKLNSVLLWHARLGFININALRQVLKENPAIKKLNFKELDESLKEREECFKGKFNKLPFVAIRT